MAAPRPAFLVSASRLSDGAVVYLSPDRGWVTGFDDAARHDDAAQRDEELAFGKTQERHVANVHVIEIGVTAEGALVLSARERFRRAGPGRVLESLGYAERAAAAGATTARKE